MLPADVEQSAITSVLVIDDSPVQRRYGIELCRELGVATAYEAGNGHDALRLLDSLAVAPAVLIIDLEMPTMDGPELLAQLRRRNIDIPIIVVSSRERSLIHSVRHMGAMLGLRVLATAQKPLTREALAAAFQSWKKAPEALARPAQRSIINAEALRVGIAGGQIQVHYHPKVEIETGAVAGVEALARWQHPSLGTISPDEFIPLAEKHELIHALTLQVMDQAMRQAAAWHARGLDLSVAVNLSPLLLDRADLVDEIVGLQQRHGVCADRLIFEMTESSLLRELAVALGVLTRLRLRGFGLSLDDYGTGFASMQQLAQIPFTELKIDRAFVHGACERETLQVMLSSAIEMAQELGLVTVAEGVESREELELLRRYRCTLAQGWLFAKPMPGGELVDWLRSHGRALRHA